MEHHMDSQVRSLSLINGAKEERLSTLELELTVLKQMEKWNVCLEQLTEKLGIATMI